MAYLLPAGVNCMKRIVLAAIIVVSLIILSFSFVPGQEMLTSLRDRTQGMINMVRTEVVPAVNSKIVAPLRDYMQNIINKVRTDVVPAVNSKIVAPLRDYMQNIINKVRTDRPS